MTEPSNRANPPTNMEAVKLQPDLTPPNLQIGPAEKMSSNEC